MPDGTIENVYRLQVLNATMVPRRLAVRAFVGRIDGPHLLAQQSRDLVVDPASTATAVVALHMGVTEAQRHGDRLAVPIYVEVVDASGLLPAKAISASAFIVRGS